MMDTPPRLPPHIAFGRKLAPWVRYNLSDSCAQTLSVAELLSFAGEDPGALQLSYASLQGDEALRGAIADLHNQLNCAQPADRHACAAEHVVTFSGAQEALHAVYRALLRPGDEVIVMTPCYPSLLTLVTACGARPVTLALTDAEGWQPDMARLETLFTDKTRLVVVNSPHNPSGAVFDSATRRQLLSLAERHGCYLLSDDVSQGTNPFGVDLAHDYFRYDKAVMVSVMSKSFGLGGVRIGWAVAREDVLLESLQASKAQGSICTSAVDEKLALWALQARDAIFARNNARVAENLSAFDQFIAGHSQHFSWHRPQAGLLALVKVNCTGAVENWCLATAQQTGVGFMPAKVFGLDGPFVRLGLGRADFREGLELLAEGVAGNTGYSRG